MNKSKKLVFFATDDFSLPSLHKLIASGYDIAAVITKPDAAAGRGRNLKSPAVKSLAKKAGIAVWQPSQVLEIGGKLKPLKLDYGVLVAYGKLIPPAVLELFKGGIINVHPSLLPKYRGPSPIEAAILNGDRQTGVSLMKLTEGMDEGPVYAQATVDIPLDLDRILLGGYLASVGADLLIRKLPAILDGSLLPQQQNSRLASYTKLLTKADGQLKWSEPAPVIERKIRAYQGFPKPRAKIDGHQIVITKARLAESAADGALVMACRPGFIEILELVAPSGRLISGADFSRGYQRLS